MTFRSPADDLKRREHSFFSAREEHKTTPATEATVPEGAAGLRYARGQGVPGFARAPEIFR